MGSKQKKFEVTPAMVAAAKESAEQISDSTVCLIPFNGAPVGSGDVLALIQMGLAMYLGKPIVLLVPEGTPIPENLLMVAKKIEYFSRTPGDLTSVRAATTRLMEWWAAQEKPEARR